MFTEVFFESASRMKGVKPNLSTAVVSILDSSEEYARPRLGGFRSALKMSFEDTYEEMKLAQPGAWPDEPTDAEHARYCQGRGERIPTLQDARTLVQFLHSLHALPQPLTLYVHCYGGVSRSAAVAQWVHTQWAIPLGTTRPTDRANRRLMRLMDKAAQGAI